jgi:hypothetical protein
MLIGRTRCGIILSPVSRLTPMMFVGLRVSEKMSDNGQHEHEHYRANAAVFLYSEVAGGGEDATAVSLARCVVRR